MSAASELVRVANALMAALEPFGEIDGEGDEDFPDETRVELRFGRTTNYGALTLGDLRRARAAFDAAEQLLDSDAA